MLSILVTPCASSGVGVGEPLENVLSVGRAHLSYPSPLVSSSLWTQSVLYHLQQRDRRMLLGMDLSRAGSPMRLSEAVTSGGKLGGAADSRGPGAHCPLSPALAAHHSSSPASFFSPAAFSMPGLPQANSSIPAKCPGKQRILKIYFYCCTRSGKVQVG